MKSFYQEWLRKSNEEKNEISSAQIDEPQHPQQPQPSTSTSKPTSTAQTTSIPETTSSTLQLVTSQASPQNDNISDLTDILFENNDLQLIIEKAAFQRQKRFRFQDHLFHVKIKLKQSNLGVPFLKDILDFLHDGLLHLMAKIKGYYNEKDANICYLTLHQSPMVIGLNSGEILYNLLFLIITYNVYKSFSLI